MADLNEEKEILLPEDDGQQVLDSPSESHELEVSRHIVKKSQDEQLYTVEDAIEKLGFGFFQVLVTLFSGLLWLADAMELMLLSVLGPAVKCQWELTTAEEAAITSVVFVGFLLGGLIWGFVSDNIGRKRGLFIVDVILLVSGVLSAIPVSPDDSKIPGYPWLLICRFFVGFGAGGTAQAVTYYAEFLPRKARGVCITILEIWWAIGSMFGALLAYGVMGPDRLGWHWYLGLAAIPLALVLLFFPLVPESARYYVVKGENHKAEKVLKRVAMYNCRKPLVGRIVTLEEKERLQSSKTNGVSNQGKGHQQATRIMELSDHTMEICSDLTSMLQHARVLYNSKKEDVVIESSMMQESQSDSEDRTRDKAEDSPLLTEEDTSSEETKKLTLKTTTQPQNIFRNSRFKSIMHFIVTTTVDRFSPLLRNGMWKTTVLLFFIWFVCAWLYYGVVLLTTTLLQYDPHCGIDVSLNATCEESELTNDDYLKILWAAAAELPGLLVTLVIIEIIGRKLTMASEFLVTMILFLLLFICASPTIITLFLFLIRAFVTGVFQVVYVYTPEVYPTSVRAFALGFHTAAARVGAIVTPYMAQVLLHVSDYATIAIYSVSALVVAILALILPIETKGRSLTDEG